MESQHFRLVKADDSQYFWKSIAKNCYRGCDTTLVFPTAITLFLSKCTSSDLDRLLDRKHFLRINLCDDDHQYSCVEAHILTISGCNSEQYKALLHACPQYMVPCEIRLGPFWHLLWLDEQMCKSKHMMLEGTALVGRDAFPNETEDEIEKVEEEDGIFIVRKRNTK